MSTYLYVCRDRSNSAVYIGITTDVAERGVSVVHT